MTDRKPGFFKTIDSNIGKSDGYCAVSFDEDDSGAEDLIDHPKIRVINHTIKRIKDFYIWEYFFYFICSFFSMTLFMLVKSLVYVEYNGPGPTNALIRALATGTAVFLVKVSFGIFTGAHLDPVSTVMTCLTFILTRGASGMAKAATWLELIKIPYFILAQFLGGLLGLALMAVSQDSPTFADCTVPVIPMPAICNAVPSVSPSLPNSVLATREMISAVVIYGFFVYGERVFGRKLPGVLFSGVYYATGVTLMMLIFGEFSGGSFGFWYWALTRWLSNTSDSHDAYWVWPWIVGLIIVAVVDVIFYYASRYFSRTKKKEALH